MRSLARPFSSTILLLPLMIGPTLLTAAEPVKPVFIPVVTPQPTATAKPATKSTSLPPLTPRKDIATASNGHPLELRFILAGGSTLRFESVVDYTAGSNSAASSGTSTHIADDPPGPGRLSLAVYREMTDTNPALILSAGFESEGLSDDDLDYGMLCARVGVGARFHLGDVFFIDCLAAARGGSVGFTASDRTVGNATEETDGYGTMFGLGGEIDAMWTINRFQLGFQIRGDGNAIAETAEFDRTGGSYEAITGYVTITGGLVLGYTL
jgi:hypothetical protein